MPRTYYFERASGENNPDSERERLVQLTREAEAAERLSLELPSSVLRRVAMLESNMRLVEAYGSSSGETQRVVERAVIEHARRRRNILHGHVDIEGHPFDVDTDEETDEEIRRELTREGYVYVANAAGERSYYYHVDENARRYLAPVPFPEVAAPRPVDRRDELEVELQRQVDEARDRQTPEERARVEGLWRRELEVFHRLRAAGVPLDEPPAAAIVPQEEEREPVWYFRRANEMAREDAERAARVDRSSVEETRQLDAYESEMRAMEAMLATTTLGNSNNRYGSSAPAAVYARQSVRVDLKALLHTAQQKLEEEIEASRGGHPFSEGAYLELTDLFRDMFLCVERI